MGASDIDRDDPRRPRLDRVLAFGFAHTADPVAAASGKTRAFALSILPAGIDESPFACRCTAQSISASSRTRQAMSGTVLSVAGSAS